MIWPLAALAVGAVALALHLELAVFTRLPRRALRVLMYHRVSDGAADRDTIPAALLERQIRWLATRGYSLVTLEEVVAHVSRAAPLPDRAVLLTFDDGTTDARTELLPVLRRTGAPAALFVVPGLAGAERDAHGRRDRFLDETGLRQVAEAGVALGLHSFSHESYARLRPEEVEEDLGRCARALAAAGLPRVPALAYPYGAYPRKDPGARAAFLEAVQRGGVVVAFRIGNRVNALPLASPLEICRTEIRGDEPGWLFGWKVRTGRRRAFA